MRITHGEHLQHSVSGREAFQHQVLIAQQEALELERYHLAYTLQRFNW